MRSMLRCAAMAVALLGVTPTDKISLARPQLTALILLLSDNSGAWQRNASRLTDADEPPVDIANAFEIAEQARATATDMLSRHVTKCCAPQRIKICA